MARCDFCGARIEQGTGKKFVRKDGRVLDFCSMKCEKSVLKLNRKPHLTRWTLTFARDKKTAKQALERHADETPGTPAVHEKKRPAKKRA